MSQLYKLSIYRTAGLCLPLLVGGTDHLFAETGTRMNVLFIIADDLNTDLGCFDDSVVVTPHLDELKRHAVRFDNAYCQFPLSGPARASFLTGYYPERTGIRNLNHRVRDKMPNVVTMPQLFKNNGYYTARIGKLFHADVPYDIGQDGKDDPQSWIETFNPIGIDRTDWRNITNYTPQRLHGKNGERLGSSMAFRSVDGPDDLHTDAIGANIACNLISRHKSDPFFIAVGFYRPHTPYVAPTRYFDLYPLEHIQLPHVPADDWAEKPEIARSSYPLNMGLNSVQLREMKRAYYAAISFIDAQVGKLLDELRRNNLTDNTIIVFCSDHGYLLGQHGQWHKTSLFEHCARTPLIISVPGMTNEESRCKRIVETLNIYPTLADICLLDQQPEDLQGVSMKSLLQKPDTIWQRAAYTTVDHKDRSHQTVTGRSIRAERYRYTEWDEGAKGGELYDYQEDPNEFNNLYDNPDYKALKDSLRTILHDKYDPKK